MARSRGGPSTKIQLLADEAGLPVAFRITPGQAVSLLEGQQTEAVIADKGYYSREIVTTIEQLGAAPSSHPGDIGNNPVATAAPCTNSETASNAASTASNSSAYSAPTTAEPSKPSEHSLLSPALGSYFSYMWIPPSALQYSQWACVHRDEP
jgi:hypothetical protein